nr:uncharacterized protein LOC102069276 isoform X2 [Zonotrichia albicollis]
MAGGLEFELDCMIFFMIQPNSPYLAEWSHLPGNFHRDSYEFIATEPSPVIICCKRADQVLREKSKFSGSKQGPQVWIAILDSWRRFPAEMCSPKEKQKYQSSVGRNPTVLQSGALSSKEAKKLFYFALPRLVRLLTEKEKEGNTNSLALHKYYCFVAQFEAKRHWAMLFRGVLMSSFLKPGFSYLHLKRLSTGWDIHLGQIKTWNTTSGAKKLLFLATCHQH